MKKKYLAVIVVALLCMCMCMFGCTKKEEVMDETLTSNVETKTEEAKSLQTEVVEFEAITLTDDLGNTVVLEKIPERIAAISGTNLGILYSIGGESIAKPDGKGSLDPVGTEALETVGAVYNINIEKLVSLHPDLVIAQVGLHNKLVPILEQSNIPVIVLEIKTFDDVVEKFDMFAKITGEEEKAEKIIKKLISKRDEIVSKLPETPKKIAILYISSKEVSIKLENSIAGDIAKILKLKNISEGEQPVKMGGETMPFSMEKIVEFDPDVILFTTMVKSQEVADEKLKSEISNNLIWGELRAVKEGNIHFLPQEYFLNNPGEYYGEGIEIMAKYVYPKVFGNESNTE